MLAFTFTSIIRSSVLAIGLIDVIFQIGVIYGVIIWSLLMTWDPSRWAYPQEFMFFDLSFPPDAPKEVIAEFITSRMGAIWVATALEVGAALLKVWAAILLISATKKDKDEKSRLKWTYSWGVVNSTVLCSNLVRILIWQWVDVGGRRLIRAVIESVCRGLFLIIVAYFLQAIHRSIKYTGRN